MLASQTHPHAPPIHFSNRRTPPLSLDDRSQLTNRGGGGGGGGVSGAGAPGDGAAALPPPEGRLNDPAAFLSASAARALTHAQVFLLA